MARRIARLFGTAHTEFASLRPDLAGAQSLIRNQEGGSTLAMASAEIHLQRLEQEFGYDMVLFTGDGGNNVMYPFLSGASVGSVDDLMQTMFDTVYIWDLPLIEQILRVRGEDLRDAYRAALESYPETDPCWKHGHYKLLGRPYRFVLKGEDRTRFHFWLGAPFWSLPLVRTLLTVPERSKAHYRFYKAVLDQLDMRWREVPYAAMFNLRVPIRYIGMYSRADGLIKSQRRLYRALRGRLIRQSEAGYSVGEWDRQLDRIVRESPMVTKYFDAKAVRRVLDAGLPQAQYNLLATILMRIDLLERGVNKPDTGVVI
jgi:hypothetical protein